MPISPDPPNGTKRISEDFQFIFRPVVFQK
jgi:hypothetical protein